MPEYLIIGNGVAGTTAAENIREHDNEGSITIVTDEDLAFYYRIRLNEFVSGDINEQDLLAKEDKWYEDSRIELSLSTRIAGADPEKKYLITADGESISYEKLLISTGSHSFVPPIKGSEKPGVFSIRDIRDARDIVQYARDVKEIVVIGGGLLGLEAGNAFIKMGKKVKVVEFFPRLLPRQLDMDGAKRLQIIMEGMGFSFRLGAKTQEIEGDDRVKGVLLEGDEDISAQMVVISAGVRPNMELAESLGLEYDKGIKVNERLMTNRADIYAAGDVAEFKGMPYGIWPAAMEQGKIAGSNMAGGDMVYSGTTMANTLKVVGIDLASAGEIDADNKYESIILSNEGVYKKIVLDNDRIIGCIMLGDTKAFNKITGVMSEKKDVSGIKDKILTEDF
jgi:nitrite reductase (NADH) large subunit